jgi:hypothetical protein
MARPKAFSLQRIRIPAAAAVLLVWAAAAHPSEGLTVLAPRETAIGRPFLVYVASTERLEQVVLRWEGGELPLETEITGDGCEAMALLGTDVGGSEPGVKILEIRYFREGKPETVSRRIDVAAVEYPSEKLTLPEAMITPPGEILDRIAREREESARALSTVTMARYWGIPMVRPVPGVITSYYGFRRILNGRPRAPHRGVDYRAADGTPVKAAADGRVILSADHYFAGRCVYLDHGGGVLTLYLHLSSRLVEVGEMVSAEDIIGLSGRSGRVTGPHLHFGLCLQGMMVNPEPLLER